MWTNVTGRVAPDTCGHCAVRHQSVCGALDETDLARLASTAVVVKFTKGHRFIDEGEPAAFFYNVTSGTVKLYKLLADGRQQVTGFAAAGHFLGLAVSDAYAFSAEAIGTVDLCRYSRLKLRLLLDDFPRLERALLAMACKELVTAQDRMLLLGRKTAQERVASFLMDYGRDDAPCADVDRIHLPMTRGDIADYLGLTIETVSRTFSRFKAEKRVGTPAHDMVVVLDRPWLLEVAAGAG